MRISEFIIEKVLLPRLKQKGCLVAYDPDRRYHDICLALASERIQVVDASESSIESREAALRGLQELGKPQSTLDGLLIYVPADKPVTEEQKQSDPFALYVACGGVFPDDDGDEFLNLCLRAKPDFATDIRRVFASNTSPPFAVIDAIGGGVNWPQLRAILKVESSRDILNALLIPNSEQIASLKEQDGWAQEVREFLRATLGMDVKTRGKTWTPLADELWRYLLYSEFVFDFPGSLPEALSVVPHAPDEARVMVEDLCDRLRSDLRTRTRYIERAESVEAELGLPDICQSVSDLGEKDTFPFEERTFLQRAIAGLLKDNPDEARRMLSRYEHSVWQGKGESQGQWGLVQAALNLCESCHDFDRQLVDHARDQERLLNFYAGSLREADRMQREFEQTVTDFLDADTLLTEVIQHARDDYRRLAEKVESLFIKHLEGAGWPPHGHLANAEVFDRFVGEALKERGRKIAYFMVDALRYELGVALEKLLSEDVSVTLHTAYAQLPTITLVGMASLLPGASNDLSLEREGETLVPKIGGMTVSNVTQRMDVLRKRFGDRFTEMPLTDFLRTKAKLRDSVELLVLRTTEIDSHLETSPETTLGLIPSTLKQIRVAIHKLRGIGFQEAVIATDHGFFLNFQAESGDVCVKPQGAWPINAHDRMLLGDGTEDGHNLVVPASKLGIRGAFSQAALPRSMAPYRAGHLYFHGGASLAEAVVPVLVVRLGATPPDKPNSVRVDIAYKNGAKRITTRLPVIDIVLVTDDMFSLESSVEILIEAQDSKGNVVGEPRPGSDINPATRTLTLVPGQRKQVPLRMDPDFEGKFTVKALHPTMLTTYNSVSLETDYTV